MAKTTFSLHRRAINQNLSGEFEKVPWNLAMGVFKSDGFDEKVCQNSIKTRRESDKMETINILMH